MNILKITLAGGISVLTTLNVHANTTCINFLNGSGNFISSEQDYGAFTATLKQSDLRLGNNRTTNGIAEYRIANPECNDNSTALFMNNSSLYIAIKPQDETVTKVEIDFCDFGGVSNVSARHSDVDYIGKLKGVDGKTLGLHNGDKTKAEIINLRTFSNFYRGDVVIEYDDLREIVIGGQELYINNICFDH